MVQTPTESHLEFWKTLQSRAEEVADFVGAAWDTLSGFCVTGLSCRRCHKADSQRTEADGLHGDPRRVAAMLLWCQIALPVGSPRRAAAAAFTAQFCHMTPAPPSLLHVSPGSFGNRLLHLHFSGNLLLQCPYLNILWLNTRQKIFFCRSIEFKSSKRH